MMLGNYANSAVRALQRDKFHAALNIAGITASLAVAFLIALYVRYEFSYENFFTTPEKVYLIQSEYRPTGQDPILMSGGPYPVHTTLQENFSENLISTYTRPMSNVITVGDRTFRKEVEFVGEHFFEVLDFPVAYGSYSGSMAEPNKVVLTELMAENFFGQSNVVGETLFISGQSFEVDAVLQNPPANTDLAFSGVFASITSAQLRPLDGIENAWYSILGHAFIRLQEDADPRVLESGLQTLVNTLIPEERQAETRYIPSLLRLDQLHLKLDAFRSNLAALYMLSAVALLLCLIACFNYINLSTAKGLTRTKEVGIHKVLGAREHPLVIRFLVEAVLTTSLSFVLAICLVAALIPTFSVMMDRALTVGALFSPAYLLMVILLTIIVSLLAGTYPAFFLASAKPKELFDKQQMTSGRQGRLRSTLVGTQMSMTVVLIVVACVVYAQSAHMRSLDFGFRNNQILVIPHLPSGENVELREVFNQRIADSPYVQMAASSQDTPREGYGGYASFSNYQNSGFQELSALVLSVDDSFFDLYGIPTLAGRGFSESLGDGLVREPLDNGYFFRGKVVISESAVPYFGLGSAQSAVGKMIVRESTNLYEIAGVIPDIHFRLARAPIVPTVYFYRSRGMEDTMEITSVRLAPDSAGSALPHIQNVWESMFPDQPFEYEFLEDRISVANAGEQRLSRMIVSLTGLTILVTSLGLFGLISFVAVRRTREIAIRKVLGAKVTDAARLLIWEFAKPVLVANLAAWPIAWIVMRLWLNGFEDRIDLSPWFFIGASVLALTIALLTVIGRTWKAAQTHPAQSLKYE